MNMKGMGMMTKPLIAMVKNMMPHEAPCNSSAIFAMDLINLLMPETEDSLVNEVEDLIVDVVVVTINRNPEAFKEKLAVLNVKIDRFLKRELEDE